MVHCFSLKCNLFVRHCVINLFRVRIEGQSFFKAPCSKETKPFLQLPDLVIRHLSDLGWGFSTRRVPHMGGGGI